METSNSYSHGPDVLATNVAAAHLILNAAHHGELPPAAAIRATGEAGLVIDLHTHDDLVTWAEWAEACVDEHHQSTPERPTYLAQGLLLDHPVELICSGDADSLERAS